MAKSYNLKYTKGIYWIFCYVNKNEQDVSVFQDVSRPWLTKAINEIPWKRLKNILMQ